ncbi:hypothetical protein AALA78_00460 [Lachnospiraceae bacterium 42-17]|jgi:hypothetical protein|nr:hypothetical protein [Dorea sp.]
MTNSQKQEVTASIKILQEAHEEIKKAFEKGQYDTVQNILAECQQVAAALGEYIEKLEDENHAVISHLEEYCEILFQIYEQLEAKVFYKNKVHRSLKKQLIKIENSVKNDISVRQQMVFFPYKASMWDSFESIYFSAKADAQCDVYCVPIPYYDLTSDHNIGQMHYEIKDFPDNIELTDWRTYDFENKKPDIAFIHNPYDNYNLVTSVHPRYYSENLKKYVGTLVYVPYNVTGGVLGKMHRFLPSYFNVDYIIAQHKRQIELYRAEISHKVKAFGSPKFDKVINQVITDEMIPEEWKPKLKDTVIFLNTGIDGLLKHNEESLLKIQYILKVSEEENITLLWRPHPLLEATIASMRPKLRDMYLETVEKFHRYQNGILDCTGNVDLAIGLSDAYIGEDTSSVSHLFGVIGKPLFFIRQGILNELKYMDNIKLSCCTSDGSSIWASAASRNALLKISRSGKVEEFYIIPNENDSSNLYSDILTNGNELYLVPRNAKEIAVFNIKDKRFTKIPLCGPQTKNKFSKGYLYENKVYFVPRMYEKMVILSCEEARLYYNKELVDELKKITGIPDVLAVANGSRLIGESLYIAAPNKPCLLEYNIKTQESIIHKIPGTVSGFCCIEKVSDKIVLGSVGRCELIIWEPLSGKTDIINNFPKGWKVDEKICFWDIVELGGDAYIFPRKNPMILRLSMNDLTLSPLKSAFPFSIEERKGEFFNHPDHFLMVKKLRDGSVMVQDANRHGLSEFFPDGSFKWKQVSVDESQELKILGERFTKVGENLPWGLYETRYYSIRRFISYVRKKLHDKERQKEAFLSAAANLDGTAGQKIYEFIMRRQQE